jgi:hypothetical protein
MISICRVLRYRADHVFRAAALAALLAISKRDHADVLRPQASALYSCQRFARS